MFALAMVLDFSNEIFGMPASQTKPIDLSFHKTIEEARQALISYILKTLGRPDLETVEDFLLEMQANDDLKGVNVNAMTPDQLIAWIHDETIGEIPLTYTIKEVPSS